jgi:hypothetical protein
MLDKLIDRIGDWNPQLFRELKHRCRGNILGAVVFTSIFIQIIGSGFFACTIISSIDDRIHSGLYFLNWMIPITLMLGGVYTIVADLNQEEQRGTLNFIRLTPQSARSIFIGKMLGVPSLIYLGVLLILPLHLGLGLYANFNLALMLVWYCTIGVATYLCLSLAILYTLYSNKHAILLTLLLALPVNTFIGFYNFLSSSALVNRGTIDSTSSSFLSWFYLPIDNNIFLLDGLIICTFSLISYWLWVTIDRKYINLASTSLTKEDSYWMNIQFQIWLLGFALPIITQLRGDRSSDRFYVLVTFYTISMVWIFVIVPSILPTKQSIQDWSRYRREYVTHEQRHWWQQDIIRDLLWHDRSPIVLAMLVNLLIPAIVWGLSFEIFTSDRELSFKAIGGIMIVSILTLIHTVIINLIFLRSKAKSTGAIPLILFMSCLPLFPAFIVTGNPVFRDSSINFLIFSPFGWMAAMQLSLPNLGMTIVGQIGILAGLTKSLQSRLQQIGKSDTQILSQHTASLAKIY